MTDVEQRLQRLEAQLEYLSSDLKVLRTLVEHDFSSALNKIRYVTEKVLYRLCKEKEVSWGKGEPTIENMIGPLIARKVIPKNVAIHVRTIQTNASPGSHYQESELSASHVHVAQVALIDFIEWYYQQSEGATELEEGIEAEAEKGARAYRVPKWKWALWFLAVGSVLLLWLLMAWKTDFHVVDLGFEDWSESFANWAIVAAVLALLCVVIWVLGRFWSSGAWNRWLLGDGFLFAGLLAFVAFIYQYSRYASTVEMLTLGTRSYEGINRSLEFFNKFDLVTSGYINTAALISVIFSFITLLILISLHFISRKVKSRRWMLSAALLILAGALVLFLGVMLKKDLLLEEGSPYFLLAMAIYWVLIATAVGSSSRGEMYPLVGAKIQTNVSLHYLAFKYGTVGLVFLLSISMITGYSGSLEALAYASAEEKYGFLSIAFGIVGEWFLTLVVLIIVLLAVILVWHRRKIFLMHGGSAWSKIAEVGRFGVLVLVALCYPFSQYSVFGDFMREWKTWWTLFPMLPAKEYYIDAAPRTWRDLCVERFVEGIEPGSTKNRFAMPVKPIVLFNTIGKHSVCAMKHAEQFKSFSLDESRVEEIQGFLDQPVRCLTPAEAQLYCASVGARLPSQREWKSSLGKTEEQAMQVNIRQREKLVEQRKFVRTVPKEWAMDLRHGSPSFLLMGDTDSEEPVEVTASQASEDIGFRCAFTF